MKRNPPSDLVRMPGITRLASGHHPFDIDGSIELLIGDIGMDAERGSAGHLLNLTRDHPGLADTRRA